MIKEKQIGEKKDAFVLKGKLDSNLENFAEDALFLYSVKQKLLKCFSAYFMFGDIAVQYDGDSFTIFISQPTIKKETCTCYLAFYDTITDQDVHSSMEFVNRQLKFEQTFREHPETEFKITELARYK